MQEERSLTGEEGEGRGQTDLADPQVWEDTQVMQLVVVEGH